MLGGQTLLLKFQCAHTQRTDDLHSQVHCANASIPYHSKSNNPGYSASLSTEFSNEHLVGLYDTLRMLDIHHIAKVKAPFLSDCFDILGTESRFAA